MPGRTTEPRQVTVTKTNASTAVTGAAGTFSPSDVGRPIAGTGIPAGATLAAVTSGTAATLSAAATAGGAGAATIGTAASQAQAAQSYGFFGYSPEDDAEAATYTVAANNANTPTPDRITNTTTRVSQRTRS